MMTPKRHWRQLLSHCPWCNSVLVTFPIVNMRLILILILMMVTMQATFGLPRGAWPRRHPPQDEAAPRAEKGEDDPTSGLQVINIDQKGILKVISKVISIRKVKCQHGRVNEIDSLSLSLSHSVSTHVITQINFKMLSRRRNIYGCKIVFSVNWKVVLALTSFLCCLENGYIHIYI